MEYCKAVKLYLEEKYINRVYGVIGAQLLVTGLIKFLSEKNPRLLNAFSHHCFLAFFVGIISFILINVFYDSVPWNFIFFGVLTCVLGIFVSIGSCKYTRKSTIKSFFFTCLWFEIVSFYGFHTVHNYSVIDKLLLDYCVAYCLFCILNTFNRRKRLVYLTDLTRYLVTSVMVISDTQAMKQQLNDKDYGFLLVAVNLYFIFIILLISCFYAYGENRSHFNDVYKEEYKTSAKSMAKSRLLSFAKRFLILDIPTVDMNVKVRDPKIYHHSDERQSSEQESVSPSVKQYKIYPPYPHDKTIFINALGMVHLKNTSSYSFNLIRDCCHEGYPHFKCSSIKYSNTDGFTLGSTSLPEKWQRKLSIKENTNGFTLGSTSLPEKWQRKLSIKQNCSENQYKFGLPKEKNYFLEVLRQIQPRDNMISVESDKLESFLPIDKSPCPCRVYHLKPPNSQCQRSRYFIDINWNYVNDRNIHFITY